MVIKQAANISVRLWVVALALTTAPLMIPAQEVDPAPESAPVSLNDEPEFLPNPNPSGLWISPRKNQSTEQQRDDERACFRSACDQTDWDPYEAYAQMVDNGYAVPLTPEELAIGLVGPAAEGARTGAIAGEIWGDMETGSEIGAAIAVARELDRLRYLDQPDNPEARRTISRFERNLKNWERKFTGCLRPKGYKVSSP